jgi:tRNA A-37 threonylcarbamoyl transferase component Bud32
MGLTPDRQKRCDEIVESALGLEAGLREQFLREACGEDHELFHEATALLQVEPGLTALFEASPAAFLKPPPNFGRYQTEEHLGSGGMSMVFRARDPVIHRAVAVKVMVQRLDSSQEDTRRFLDELHLLGSLGHPNIVQVFDAGEHGGMPFIVMEYLEGENLAEAIANGHCDSLSTRLSIARQVAEALERVHAALVCHRDVKPANIFVERTGRIKLMDFGVSARLNGPRLTQTGALIGTLPYLAPEQIRGEKATSAVDIYAYGVLLFELFTGTRPFSGNTAELLYKIAHEDIPTAALAGLPPRLSGLIRRATSKDAADRPRDFSEILQILSNISPESATRGRPFAKRVRAAAGVAGALILVAAGAAVVSIRKPSAVPAQRPSPTGGPVMPAQRLVAEPSAVAPSAPKTMAAVPQGQGEPSEEPKKSPPAFDAAPRPAIIERRQIRPEDFGEAPKTAAQPARQEARLPDPPLATPPQVLENPFKTNIFPLSPPPEAKPSPVAGRPEQEKIRDVLRRYEAAYQGRSILDMEAIFPGLKASPYYAALDREMSDPRSIEIHLNPEAEIALDGDTASVRCVATVTRTQPKSGLLDKRSPHKQQKALTFHFRKTNGSWTIVSIQ